MTVAPSGENAMSLAPPNSAGRADRCAHVARSQSRSDPSVSLNARVRLSGENLIFDRHLRDLGITRDRPSATSQSRISPTFDKVARARPSGDQTNATFLDPSSRT